MAVKKTRLPVFEWVIDEEGYKLQISLPARLDHRGRRTRASEILGINRRTLQNKLKQYRLNTPPSRPA